MPGAIEQPNGIDDNCNGTIDEGTSAYDDDGDGFSEDQGDCDDGNITINPDATEDCSDGIDNNCNNTQNEENALNCTTFYRDADADGYGDVQLLSAGAAPVAPLASTQRPTAMIAMTVIQMPTPLRADTLASTEATVLLITIATAARKNTSPASVPAAAGRQASMMPAP